MRMINIPDRPHAHATQLMVELVSSSALSHDNPYPLALLPGGPGGNSTHFAAYQQLQTDVNLLFFNPRGCGRSQKSQTQEYSLNNYIEDLEVTRKALSLDKLNLLGKSYSGFVALGYALRYPKNVSKLILVSTGPSHHFIKTAQQKLNEIGTAEQINVSKKLWQGSFSSTDEVSDYFNTMMPLYSATPIKTKPSVDELPFAYEPLNQGFSTDLRKVDYTKQLTQISCDTLILTGDKDWIFDVKYSQYMADAIPNAQLIIYPNVGHFIELDAGDQYFKDILSFQLSKSSLVELA